MVLTPSGLAGHFSLCCCSQTLQPLEKPQVSSEGAEISLWRHRLPSTAFLMYCKCTSEGAVNHSSWPDLEVASTSKPWCGWHITLDWWCSPLFLLPPLALATQTDGQRASLWELALMNIADEAMPMPVQTSIILLLWIKMCTRICAFPSFPFHRCKTKIELAAMPVAHNSARKNENHVYRAA